MATNNQELVKSQLNQVKNQQIRKKELTPKKSPVWNYPIGLERDYFKFIKTILMQFINITTNEIKPKLSIWNQENVNAGLKDSNFLLIKTTDNLVNDLKNIKHQIRKHYDAPSEDIQNINKDFEQLKKEMFGEDNKTLIDQLIPIATSIIIFNNKQFQKMLKTQTKTELFLSEPYLQEMVKQWTTNNVNLITNLTNEYTKKINNAIIDAFQKNKSMSDLSKTLTNINKEFANGKPTTIFKLDDGRRIVYKNEQIKNSIKIQEKIKQWKKEDKIDLITKGNTQSRSDLIARDQLSKLNSQVTKKRQEEAGVSMYIWHTAEDERVRGKPGGVYANARPSHWAMEGKVCKWDDATVYADSIEDALKGKWKSRSSINAIQLHPGQDINCRCWSEAVWNDVIEEVNNEK